MQCACVLAAKSVSKSYAGPSEVEPVAILRNVSLSLKLGESVAIVGPSGCGKSTLLNVLGTLDRPDSGTLSFRGRDVTGMSEGELAELRARHLGFVFQAHHLLPQCGALENVLIPTLVIGGRNRSADEALGRELLEAVGLGGRLGSRPDQLSGGERQRVAVARALINQPEVILADEPTGSLDEGAAALLTGLLLKLSVERGATLVMVTHQAEQARRMGRILRLKDGVLVDGGV